VSRSSGLVLGRRQVGGFGTGPRLKLGERSSLLVVGATQSGKTSSLVIPALLHWPGAAVVCSVKRDLYDVTAQYRSEVGDVTVLDPGREAGATWNPLEGVTSYRHAMRVARDMVLPTPPAGESAFWNALSVKLLGTLLALAIERNEDIFSVVQVLENRDFGRWSYQGIPSLASETLDNFLRYEPKTLDGVCTTTETMLLPWHFRQPLATVRNVVSGPNSLFMCSPKGEQSHYEPLFRGALRMVLEEQQTLRDRHEQRPLLVVLDEAAAVASLDDLDQIAATVSGLDVTLVTVVQDFAQLTARWGAKAPTIVNNHTTRLVFGGLADPSASTFIPELIFEGKKARKLRELPLGTAVLVAGRKPAVVLSTKGWWRQRELKQKIPKHGSVPLEGERTAEIRQRRHSRL